MYKTSSLHELIVKDMDSKTVLKAVLEAVAFMEEIRPLGKDARIIVALSASLLSEKEIENTLESSVPKIMVELDTIFFQEEEHDCLEVTLVDRDVLRARKFLLKVKELTPKEEEIYKRLRKDNILAREALEAALILSKAS